MVLLSVYLVREAQRDRRERTEGIYLGWPAASWQWAQHQPPEATPRG